MKLVISVSSGVVRLSAGLGLAVALVLWPLMGWQTAALFAVGAAISVGSVYEWARLIRTVMARLDRTETPAEGAGDLSFRDAWGRLAAVWSGLAADISEEFLARG